MKTVLVIAGLGLAACQPMYGEKAAKVSTPRIKPHPQTTAVAALEVKPIETCETSFQDPAALARQSMNPAQSAAATTTADGAMSQAARATDDESQGRFWRIAIDGYRTALIKNPWDPQATLKLARAYDAVLRKGCALALLRRIGQMELNVRYTIPANVAADEVAANSQMFTKYRDDAKAAVHR